MAQQRFAQPVFVDACLPERADIGDLLEGQLVSIALSLRVCDHTSIPSENLARKQGPRKLQRPLEVQGRQEQTAGPQPRDDSPSDAFRFLRHFVTKTIHYEICKQHGKAMTKRPG